MRAGVVRVLLVLCPLVFGGDLLHAEGYVTENNVIFGRGGDVDLQLDLCRPATGAGPFPALVFITGSGWGYYAFSRMSAPIEIAASKGYVAVTIDHRLTSVKSNGKTKYPFPAQIEDAKCAVRWLRANANKYNIDVDRIGAVGFSSGGHLALLLGLTTPTDGFEGTGGNLEYSSRVQAVVCMAGLVEAQSFYRETNVPARVSSLLGGTPEEVPQQYISASPLTYVHKDHPPVLFMQGQFDTSCPLKQAQLLEAKMKDVGGEFTLIVTKSGSHEPSWGAPEVWKFLDGHLKQVGN